MTDSDQDNTLQESHDNNEQSSQSVPVRGPDGRFLSTKSNMTDSNQDEHHSEDGQQKVEPEQDSQKSENKAHPTNENETSGEGIIYVPSFFRQTIRKVYKDGQWLFNVEDILSLGQRGTPPVPLKSLEDLRKKKAFNEFFEEHMVEYQDMNFMNADDMIELTHLSKARFPGPFVRWITEATQMSPHEPFAPVWEPPE